MTTVVDVVIPLHRVDRPIEAAVASAQSAIQGLQTRVIVVLHNLPLQEDEVRARLDFEPVLLRCDDGVPSPSGPRNVGLDAGSAPFVFFLDSDDRLAPDCLRQLYEVATITNADVVLPSIRRGRSYIGTPLVFSRRVRTLDVVKHHLFLRSHVPALLRRSTLDARGSRYPERVRSGEDFVLLSQLYATGATAMAFDAVYIVDGAATERASTTSLPAGDQLAAIRCVLTSSWIDDLPATARDALIHRVLSVNLAAGWRAKKKLGQTPSRAEHVAVRDLALDRSVNVAGVLSVRDVASLDFDLRPGMCKRLLQTRPFGLIARSISGMLSSRGPLAVQARGVVVRHRPRRIARHV